MFFKEQIKKRIKNEKGLTLIELLAVIVILAIIAAIAIPAIGNIIRNSESKAIVSDAQNMMNAGQLYFVDYPTKETFTNTDEDGDTKVSTLAEFNEFVESKGDLEEITVVKGSPNTIKFKAEVNGLEAAEYGPFTLDQLNKAEVKKGIIKIPGTGTDVGKKEDSYLGGEQEDFK